MSTTLKAHFLVMMATFLVAGSFIASAKLSGVIDPISLTLFRFVFATVILAPVIFLNKNYRSKIRQSFPKAMKISLFYSLYFIGLFKSLEYTTALNTGTLFTLTPLLTAVLAVFIFKQKITIFQLSVYITGMIGTCIVVFKGDLGLLLNFSLNAGDIIFLSALIAMVLYVISVKYFYREDDEVLVLTFMTLVGGCIWMGAALNIVDIPLQWYRIKGELFFYMAYLTVGATIFTVYLYQKATVVLGPKKLTAYVYLNPAAVVVLDLIFNQNGINLYAVIGILISSFATIILLAKS